MDNQQAQLDIQKQLRERQDKFVYYLIALCVAAIGFSVTQTVGQKFEYLHYLLGTALLCWVISIFCGFQFQQIVMKGLFANNQYFDTIGGHLEGVEPSALVDEVAKNILREKRDNYSKRSQRNFILQQYLFYAGLILFLAWHVIQMMRK